VMPKHIKHFKDLDFTVVAEPNDYSVDYVIYDVEGWCTDDTPVWHRAGAQGHPDCVDTLEEAEPYLHGHVKWDGCSNWAFDEQERVMLHGCSRKDVLRFGEIMAACWDWTKELCPNWDRYGEESDAK
jgi:hypothetical protein